MVCTAVTTVCGIWLAYGEPPNLIMKANLYPYLTNSFFLRYCAPAAVASYLVIAWNLRRKLGGKRIELEKMDVLDAQVATVRFLQAERHGALLLRHAAHVAVAYRGALVFAHAVRRAAAAVMMAEGAAADHFLSPAIASAAIFFALSSISSVIGVPRPLRMVRSVL